MSDAREFFRGKSDTQLEKLWADWNEEDPRRLGRSRTSSNVGGVSASYQIDCSDAEMFKGLREEIQSRPALANKLGVKRICNRMAVKCR